LYLSSVCRPIVSFTVTAGERGSTLTGTAQVVIDLTDVNDNSPMFPSNLEFSVAENEPVGTLVGIIQTTDEDSGVNAEVYTSNRMLCVFNVCV